MKKESFKVFLYIFFAGLIFSVQALLAQPLEVTFRNLGPGDGLPVTSITSVTQDISGIIWIGSWDGVFTYDGKKFTKKTNSGRYVVADKKGGIWISIGGGNLQYYNIVNDSIKTYNISTTSRYTLTAIDKDENVWATTPSGIISLNTETDSFEIDPGQKTGNSGSIKVKQNGDLLFYFEDDKNSVYIGQRDKNGIYSYIPFPSDKNNPDSNAGFLDGNTAFIAPYASSGILILNNYGWAIKETEADDWQFKKPANQSQINRFDAALIDDNGNIWLSAENEISRINPETGKLIMYLNNPKIQNSILPMSGFPGTRMFIDRQGILWIPRFSGGISRLNLYESDFGLIKKPDGEQIVDPLSALELKDSSYWIGVRQGSNSLIHFSTDGNIIEQIDAVGNSCPPGRSEGIKLSDPFIWSLAQTSDGSIWVGTGNPSPISGGLNRILPGNKKIVRFKNDPNDPASLPGNWLGTMEVDGSDRVWMSYRSGACWIDPKTEKITNVTIKDLEPDLKTDSIVPVYLLMVTSNGDIILWAENKHYLVHHENLSSEPFGPNDASVTGAYYNHEDNTGRIWFYTEDGFGYLDSTRKKTDRFYNFNNIDFPAHEIVAINSDKNGFIWMATDNGIVQFNPSKEEFAHFAYSRGLQGNAFLPYINHRGPSGFIYFGGNGGLNRFNPTNMITNPFPPAMVFTGLKLNGNSIQPGINSELNQPLNVAKEIIVGPEVSVISIDFSAIHFAGFNDNQYQYRLEGFDKTWRNGGTTGNATYTNLTNGKYKLYIKGSNWDGVWSDGSKSVTIIVLPPWYKTRLAYLIYATLFIVFIFFFDRYRKKRLLEKERALARERELAQAKEIEKAYNELEISHENLKSAQAQLIQAEKMASLGELTAGIAHEIQNPLNFVNNFSEVSQELIAELKEELATGNLQPATEISDDLNQNLGKILHHGKRAEAIVKGMLLHSRGSSGQKELTDLNALCDEYLRLSYHGFRAKDKSFNADFKLEADENLPKIEVVPQDIGRVLLNLINNAFFAVNEKAKNFTPRPPEGGAKSASNEFKPMVIVRTTSSKSPSGDLGVRISVQDNGNGIPGHIKEKIFQPFFTTKPTGQGTGLGLSLSYDIVKAHGGEIKIESREGEGTEFIIQIPIS